MYLTSYLSIHLGTVGLDWERSANATDAARSLTLVRVSCSFSEACINLPFSSRAGVTMGHLLNGLLNLSISSSA